MRRTTLGPVDLNRSVDMSFELPRRKSFGTLGASKVGEPVSTKKPAQASSRTGSGAPGASFGPDPRCVRAGRATASGW